MQHEFTDDQIIDAKHAAAHNLSRDWISRFNVTDIRALLDALPEPEQDDWQECAFEDIRKGDRVKVVKQNGDYMVFTAESVDRLRVHGEDCHVSHTTTATLFRIPAPVEYPNPLEHQYILVHEFNSEHPIWVMPVLGKASDKDGYYINGVFRYTTEITDWQHLTPAKVVADDD